MHRTTISAFYQKGLIQHLEVANASIGTYNTEVPASLSYVLRDNDATMLPPHGGL